jgi:hypothetical protein
MNRGFLLKVNNNDRPDTYENRVALEGFVKRKKASKDFADQKEELETQILKNNAEVVRMNMENQNKKTKIDNATNDYFSRVYGENTFKTIIPDYALDNVLRFDVRRKDRDLRVDLLDNLAAIAEIWPRESNDWIQKSDGNWHIHDEISKWVNKKEKSPVVDIVNDLQQKYNIPSTRNPILTQNSQQQS